MAKEDAWAKGYKETQARYLEELRKERDAAEARRQQELNALRAASKALKGGK
jgi:hypothetical protein